MKSPKTNQNIKKDVKKTKTIEDKRNYIIDLYPEYKEYFSKLCDALIENLYYTHLPNSEAHKKELQQHYKGVWWAERSIKEYYDNKKINYKPTFDYTYDINKEN